MSFVDQISQHVVDEIRQRSALPLGSFGRRVKFNTFSFE